MHRRPAIDGGSRTQAFDIDRGLQNHGPAQRGGAGLRFVFGLIQKFDGAGQPVAQFRVALFQTLGHGEIAGAKAKGGNQIAKNDHPQNRHAKAAKPRTRTPRSWNRNR